MRYRSFRGPAWPLALSLIATLGAEDAAAQLRDASALSDQSAATEQTVRFRVGVIVRAKRGAVADVFAAVAVPIDCPEQTVTLVEEDVTKNVAGYEFRDLTGGIARQMIVSIPYLEPKREARAVLTFEVTTRTTVAPPASTTAEYAIPDRAPRNLRGYLGASPFIQTRHGAIKRLAKSIQEDLEAEEPTPTDWRRLEAVYDHVMDEIEYLEGPDTSAVDTLEAGQADCHGRSALFVALARATGAPARLVWVNEHCYPEFYLEDAAGEGAWFPAESAGTRDFGGMPLARPILQKGDNFRVPERGRERLRYATDYLTGRPAQRGGGPPSHEYVREVVSGD